MRSAWRCAIFSRSLGIEREALEEFDRAPIGFVLPVDGEHYVVDTQGFDRAEQCGRRKIAAAGDGKILRQVFRRGFLEAAARRGLMRLIVEAMQHERQTLAEVTEDDPEIGESVEQSGKHQPQEVRAGVDRKAPRGETELLLAFEIRLHHRRVRRTEFGCNSLRDRDQCLARGDFTARRSSQGCIDAGWRFLRRVFVDGGDA
jgi:hypothetical protein